MTVVGERGVVELGGKPLTVEDVLQVARGDVDVALRADPGYRAFLAEGPRVLHRHLAGGGAVYGVTTGFGDSCVSEIPPELVADVPANLVRFHGCGVGGFLEPEESAAVVLVRASTLAQGYSAVRPVVVEGLLDLLRHRLLPLIPRRGSVGASGDLTPLSYVAAVLMGEREVTVDGRVVPAAEALREAGIEPLALAPKESLALMNGTAVMAALGCLAFHRAAYLARLACALTAVASDVTRGNPTHFHDRTFELKPHPGMRAAARWIREGLHAAADDENGGGDGGGDGGNGGAVQPGRLQDRYSIRCAPHVVGVLLDALPWIGRTLEIEINSVNDNPLVDPQSGAILHGGNFYGGHLCFALDALKAAVANVADLLERQLLLLCQPATSNGLPTDLVAVTGPAEAAHHGFKAMQITASALTAEALKATVPASVFSRSTENHNQDKVSMGTIAAHDALHVLDLSETVAAVHLLALAQAVDLRGREGCGRDALALWRAVRSVAPANTGDRRQDRDIAAVVDLVRRRALSLDASFGGGDIG